MTDTELIIQEFCVPIESEKVCDELCGWDEDKYGFSWCEKHCNFDCPQMICYKEWLKMKRSEESEQ